MKRIKKKDFCINIFFSLIFIILICINNSFIGSDSSLMLKVILDGIVGLIFILFSYIKLKGLKNLYRNIEFVYGISFFIYSIVGCIIFILDEYTPRFYYFKINEKILVQTLSIYINTFCIYSMLCFLFNRFKYINYDEALYRDGNSRILSRKVLIFFDFVALFVTLLNLIKIFSYGTSFFNLTTAAKRNVINSGISHYINLFMVIYSLFVSLLYFTNENFKKNKSAKINILSIVIYWLITLTCERRMFVTFLLGFFFIILVNVKKINFKKLIIAIFIIIFLLFSAAIRDNINFSNHDFVDVLYSSSTEFYCTFMISDAYMYYNHDLEYGKTYIIDSITKLFPKALLKNKSEDLSFKFKKEYNTNVGFAFNPIAEGILNFGKIAPLIVAFLMFFICSFANNMVKRNIMYYIILLTFSLDFCRGAFSNVFFDTIFCFIFIFVMFKVSISKNKKCIGGKLSER